MEIIFRENGLKEGDVSWPVASIVRAPDLQRQFCKPIKQGLLWRRNNRSQLCWQPCQPDD